MWNFRNRLKPSMFISPQLVIMIVTLADWLYRLLKPKDKDGTP